MNATFSLLIGFGGLCYSIIFGIIGAKKHNFLNGHCHGIISKLWCILYGNKLNLGSMFLKCVWLKAFYKLFRDESR